MRILILAEFLTNLGGCENLCVQLALTIAAQGDEVLLVVRSHSIHPRWSSMLSTLPCVTLSEDKPLRQLNELIDSWQPDLIHAVPYDKTIFQLLHHRHDLVIVGTEPCDGSLRCGWWYSGQPLQEVLPRFNGVHVLSHRALHNLRVEYGWDGPSEVILPPFSFTAPWPLWKRKTPIYRLFFAGRLATEKGIEQLIGSLAQARRVIAPISIDIWGTGHEEDYLKRLAIVAGVSSWINFRGGFASFDKIPFQDYDAMILPSWFEGMPYVFIEALSSGLPTVVSSNGGMKELSGVEALAHFFEPGCQDALVNALANLYKHYAVNADAPDLRRRLVADQFSPVVVNERYQEFYRSILS